MSMDLSRSCKGIERLRKHRRGIMRVVRWLSNKREARAQGETVRWKKEETDALHCSGRLIRSAPMRCHTLHST